MAFIKKLDDVAVRFIGTRYGTSDMATQDDSICATIDFKDNGIEMDANLCAFVKGYPMSQKLLVKVHPKCNWYTKDIDRIVRPNSIDLHETILHCDIELNVLYKSDGCDMVGCYAMNIVVKNYLENRNTLYQPPTVDYVIAKESVIQYYTRGGGENILHTTCTKAAKFKAGSLVYETNNDVSKMIEFREMALKSLDKTIDRINSKRPIGCSEAIDKDEIKKCIGSSMTDIALYIDKLISKCEDNDRAKKKTKYDECYNKAYFEFKEISINKYIDTLIKESEVRLSNSGTKYIIYLREIYDLRCDILRPIIANRKQAIEQKQVERLKQKSVVEEMIIDKNRNKEYVVDTNNEVPLTKPNNTEECPYLESIDTFKGFDVKAILDLGNPDKRNCGYRYK